MTFLGWIASSKVDLQQCLGVIPHSLLRLRLITTNASAAHTTETIHAIFTIVWCRMLQIDHLKSMHFSLQILYILLELDQLLVQELRLTRVRAGGLQQERRL